MGIPDIKRVRSYTEDRAFYDPAGAPILPGLPGPAFAGRPTTPGGGPVRLEPLRRPGSNHNNNSINSHNSLQHTVDPEAADRSLEELKNSELFGGHDGIGTLIDAAAVADGGRGGHSRSASFNSTRPSLSHTRNASQLGMSGYSQMQDIKPVIHRGADDAAALHDEDTVGYQTAIKAWNRSRFVRAGYFTPKEGMAYIDYFYKYLYPLTPIRIPDLRAPANHLKLLQEEPMLAITILTIASRYMKLSGSGGEYSRPSVIHDALWKHLRHMMERTIWAQEQFGGGFSGGGAETARKLDPFTQQGLRTLGTVESFMLLTEWHPRALHFPPGDDDAELLVPENPENSPSASDETPLLLNGYVGQRRDSWLEPCWRSDRMCWMLLSNALGLAFEIGVFAKQTEAQFMHEHGSLPADKVRAYFVRRTHLKELLWIYYVQTSGRLELISRIPEGFFESLHQTTADSRIADLVRGRMDNISNNPDRVFSPTTISRDYVEDPHEITLIFWEEIAAILKSGNHEMFRGRAYTREIIKSGKYADYLDVYKPLLDDWKKEFDACTSSEYFVYYSTSSH
jgi:hypothetical protein